MLYRLEAGLEAAAINSVRQMPIILAGSHSHTQLKSAIILKLTRKVT